MRKGDIITDPTDTKSIKRRCYVQFYANKLHTGMTNFLKNTDYQNWHEEEIETSNSQYLLKKFNL